MEEMRKEGDIISLILFSIQSFNNLSNLGEIKISVSKDLESLPKSLPTDFLSNQITINVKILPIIPPPLSSFLSLFSPTKYTLNVKILLPIPPSFSFFPLFSHTKQTLNVLTN